MLKIRGLRWWMIGLIMLGSIINYLTRSTLAVAAPTILAALHITTWQYSWIVGAFPDRHNGTAGRRLCPGRARPQARFRRSSSASAYLTSLAPPCFGRWFASAASRASRPPCKQAGPEFRVCHYSVRTTYTHMLAIEARKAKDQRRGRREKQKSPTASAPSALRLMGCGYSAPCN
jgi:hypothetical protein